VPNNLAKSAPNNSASDKLAYSPIMDELGGLSEEARKEAMDRFRLLKRHLEGNQPLDAATAIVIHHA